MRRGRPGCKIKAQLWTCLLYPTVQTNSGTGFAVLFPTHHYQIRLPKESSVLTAELSAVLYALQQLFYVPSSSFTIFTDSRTSLTLLQSLRTTHPLVQEIQDWLFRVSVWHKSVCSCWVPSHVGITGNERVNFLARNIPLTDRLRPRNLPASDYYPLFRTFLITRWQTFWSTIIPHAGCQAFFTKTFPWCQANLDFSFLLKCVE